MAQGYPTHILARTQDPSRAKSPAYQPGHLTWDIHKLFGGTFPLATLLQQHDLSNNGNSESADSHAADAVRPHPELAKGGIAAAQDALKFLV